MTNGSWRVDETYLRVAGKWTYLYRAVVGWCEAHSVDYVLGFARNERLRRIIDPQMQEAAARHRGRAAMYIGAQSAQAFLMDAERIEVT